MDSCHYAPFSLGLELGAPVPGSASVSLCEYERMAVPGRLPPVKGADTLPPAWSARDGARAGLGISPTWSDCGNLGLRLEMAQCPVEGRGSPSPLLVGGSCRAPWTSL
ncbi:hypothetical protein KIL84_000040 [Mauremys mutica]|uniref:Uncharacterized protein n=1 Tax=Mauremys mutica TaxID=74926 RepID=A0A9D4B305_9SAUR|nr:hypothetical protein KIL84_000040 [Mauremys mutica]